MIQPPPNRERDECGTCDGKGTMKTYSSYKAELLGEPYAEVPCANCTPPKDGTEGGGKEELDRKISEAENERDYLNDKIRQLENERAKLYGYGN